jgi:hypothetical protein
VPQGMVLTRWQKKKVPEFFTSLSNDKLSFSVSAPVEAILHQQGTFETKLKY